MSAIEQFDRAETEKDLLKELLKTTASFGYEYLCCVSAPSTQHKTFADKVLLNDWPSGWFEQYHLRNFHSVDPVAKFLRSQTRAFRWSDVPLPRDNDAAIEVMTEAHAGFDLKMGYCIPIHSLAGYQAGISFAGRESDQTDAANSVMSIIGIYAVNRLTNIKAEGKSLPVLSLREREVLTWTAAGKTDRDTGEILNIQEDTVTKHVQSAMRKLNVCNRAQAIAESIRRGEISL
jgi:LuxR family quorum sensing-dependent transcriptional regulator